jgi:3-isopropylmalate/(R)-2-methylmalate dehydratase small subunit
MPLIECPEAEKIQQGDSIDVLVNDGVIRNATRDEVYKFTVIPQFMQELIDAGGVIEFRAKQMGYKRKQ